MGMVHAEITLKNVADVTRAEVGLMQDSEVRQTTVTALVDTGAATLVINEEMRRQLGLKVQKERPVRLANNRRETVKVAEPVKICWKNRDMVCQPWVVPDSPNILLGAIPLEDMDLIVDPANEELIGAHGDEIIAFL